MTIFPRAITAPELALLRSKNQWSELYLAIHKPVTVYTARVNQTEFGDPIVSITYDGGSGNLEDVLDGMTMYVGSSAGAYDKGMVRIRIRNSLPADTFTIGESSEIKWADDDYLTIVDEFNLWSRHLVIRNLTVEMDYDIDYEDQHNNLDPVPVLGPHAVLWLAGSTVDFEPNASNSWVLGSTIVSYLWVATGASSTSNLDTATPTITYDTAGQYRVQCTVTADNEKSTTGYRYVFVYDTENMPVTQFSIQNCTGDLSRGGWSFNVKLYDEVALSDVRERALVILFAKDRYNDAIQSLGYLESYENIISIGWISQENLQYSNDFSEVSFTVEGPAYWLSQINGYPIGMEYSTSSSVWTQMDDLTVDRALWHLMHWRSTATLCLDIFLSGVESLAPAMEAPIGSLWEQITTIAKESILAIPACDRYGRLFIEVYTSYILEVDRATIPTTMLLTKDDYEDSYSLERKTTPQTGLVEASGITFDGTSAIPLFSKAPGIVLSRYGVSTSMGRLLLDDQDHCNSIAGFLYANQNNKYPNLDIQLGQNNRFIDIASRQRVTFSISSTDFPRGISWTTKNMLPKRVEYLFDSKSGLLSVKLELEAETGIDQNDKPGVTVVPPQPVDPGIVEPPDPGGFPIFPPPYIWFPPWIPQPPPENPQCLTIGNGPYAIHWDKSSIQSSSVESERTARCWFPCNIRDTGVWPTKLVIKGLFYEFNIATNSWVIQNSDNSWYTLAAIDLDDTVLAYANSVAQWDYNIKMFQFGIGGNVNIKGFKLFINSEEDTGYTVGSEISAGDVLGNDPDGVTINGLTPGNYYSVITSGGPIAFGDDPDVTKISYVLSLDFGSGLAQTGGYRINQGSGISGYYNATGAIVYWYRIGNYSRVFFIANQSSVQIYFGDSNYEDNSGSLHYVLSNANITGGFKIDIYDSYLREICPVL